MLKIKDNVDLKELEKFGFYEFRGNYTKHTANAYWCVREKDRIIVFSSGMGLWARTLTELYDLIQAGLVEKVVEE